MSKKERLVDGFAEPTPEVVSNFIGRENARRWVRLLNFIDAKYPGAFRGEWLYGGAKHGWSLRFKKSKSFCTLIPERGCMNVVMVFGAAERDKAEALLPSLVSHVRDDYLGATTYHDGKWVLIEVDSDDVLGDIERLLEVKRRPSAPPKLNAEWHSANKMPRNAALEQRIQWHLEHQKHCACRGVPPKIQEELARRGR